MVSTTFHHIHLYLQRLSLLRNEHRLTPGIVDMVILPPHGQTHIYCSPINFQYLQIIKRLLFVTPVIKNQCVHHGNIYVHKKGVKAYPTICGMFDFVQYRKERSIQKLSTFMEADFVLTHYNLCKSCY